MISVETSPPVLFFITCIYLKYKGDYARNEAGKITFAEQNMKNYSFFTVF